MNNCYVYAYLNPEKPIDKNYNGTHFEFEPFYIGRGKNKRDISHLRYVKQEIRCGRISNYNLKNYKFGKMKIMVNLLSKNKEPIIIRLKNNLTTEEADAEEIKYISAIGKMLNETGPLTNLTDGGKTTTGYIHTPKTKKKISEAKKGKTFIKIYGEEQAKIMAERKRIIMTGKKRKPLSDETKEKIRKKLIGSKDSEETRLKKSRASKGKPKSEEHKRKIKEAAQARAKRERGKTWEELYGVERAAEKKEKRRLTMLRKKANKDV